jgi:hypothetical protein
VFLAIHLRYMASSTQELGRGASSTVWRAELYNNRCSPIPAHKPTRQAISLLWADIVSKNNTIIRTAAKAWSQSRSCSYEENCSIRYTGIFFVIKDSYAMWISSRWVSSVFLRVTGPSMQFGKELDSLLLPRLKGIYVVFISLVFQGVKRHCIPHFM